VVAVIRAIDPRVRYRLLDHDLGAEEACHRHAGHTDGHELVRRAIYDRLTAVHRNAVATSGHRDTAADAIEANRWVVAIRLDMLEEVAEFRTRFPEMLFTDAVEHIECVFDGKIATGSVWESAIQRVWDGGDPKTIARFWLDEE
jgi:hypothetical protein